MPFVAIIGAGELGASIARAIANRGRVGEVRLIDAAADVAAGKALDIQQAGPIENSPTRLIASADITAAAGAAVVVLADHAHNAAASGGGVPASINEAPAAAATSELASRVAAASGGGVPASTNEWSGEAALALVKRLAGIDREAVFLCAGAAQDELLVHGLDELRLPRTRFFGSAPEAIVSVLRALVAVEADLSPSVIGLTVLGRIPGRIVVLWRDATIAGRSLASVLDPVQIARIGRRFAAMGSPGPYTLAAAAARVSEMIVMGSRKIVCCTVGLDGEFGIRRAISSVPVVTGSRGIERIIAPALERREQVLLENAVESEFGGG